METIFHQLYYNLDSPIAFSGPRNLYREAKKKLPTVKFSDVQKWMHTQNAYSLHRPRHSSHFQRRKTITKGLDDLHQLDLLDVSHLAHYNSGIKYLLVAICCFSRFALVQPLKRKLAESVSDVIEFMYSRSGRIPKRIQTDKGTEFLGQPTQNIFKN
jgi:hypothetical protein